MKLWSVMRLLAGKSFEGSLVTISSPSSPRMGKCSSRTVTYVKPFGVFLGKFCPLAWSPDTGVLQRFSRLPCLQEAEAASCKGLVTECEVRVASKQVGLNKSLGLDGLPYEVYLKMSHLFVPNLMDVFNDLFAQEAIPGSKGVMTLLKKSGRHVWEELDDYRPLTLLNTELKILIWVLANRPQLVVSDLVGPEQNYAVKGR